MQSCPLLSRLLRFFPPQTFCRNSSVWLLSVIFWQTSLSALAGFTEEEEAVELETSRRTWSQQSFQTPAGWSWLLLQKRTTTDTLSRVRRSWSRSGNSTHKQLQCYFVRGGAVPSFLLEKNDRTWQRGVFEKLENRLQQNNIRDEEDHRPQAGGSGSDRWKSGRILQQVQLRNKLRVSEEFLLVTGTRIQENCSMSLKMGFVSKS